MESVGKPKNILFIVNPISGRGVGRRLPYVIKNLPEYDNISYEIKFTAYAGHARIITQEEKQKGKFTHIIAVGGDGTVNEIGAELRESEINFGIVSLGSGNGFARHLGYSVHLKKVLRQVLSDKFIQVDMLEINGVYSLNVSGAGFDAEVAHEFNRFRIRGVFSYIWAGVKLWFRYPEKEYTIRYDGKVLKKKCFIISFANSSQYGNNAKIAPQASLTDGLVDICFLERPPFWAILPFLFYFLNAALNDLSYYGFIQCKEAIITGDIHKVHIDGDAAFMSSPLKIKVYPKALRVILPE